MPMDSSAPLPEFSWPPDDADVKNVLQQMAADGSWGRYHGPHCDKLIQQLQDFQAVPFVKLCSSGTAAVELALRAAGVQSGDEVVLSAYDYKANFANILNLKATPVLVDVEAETLSPSAAQFASAIGSNTKAVIASHLHGWLSPVQALQELCSEKGVTLIEDACQSPGASVGNQMAGSVGDLGVLSFGGSKLLSAGRGGAVLTSNARLAQRMHLYTQRGNDVYPLSEMQAAVLKPQVDKLPERNRQRAQSVQRLTDLLPTDGELHPVLHPDFRKSAFYKMPFLVTEGSTPRGEIVSRCQAAGVVLSEAFPALHRIHSKSRFRTMSSLQNAEALHHRLVTLHHPVLLHDVSIARRWPYFGDG